MKNLTNFIQKKYVIDNNTYNYTCHPKNKIELRKILEERLDEDKDANLNDIDVSKITNMGLYDGSKGLFEDLDPHNIDISEWDVSNVKDMSFMFYKCENFIGKGLENWNVSKVIDMYEMFFRCKNFNADLSNWDVSKVKTLSFMFYGCENFNYNLNKWNVSNETHTDNAFDKCNSLKNKPTWYKG